MNIRQLFVHENNKTNTLHKPKTIPLYIQHTHDIRQPHIPTPPVNKARVILVLSPASKLKGSEWRASECETLNPGADYVRQASHFPVGLNKRCRYVERTVSTQPNHSSFPLIKKLGVCF